MGSGMHNNYLFVCVCVLCFSGFDGNVFSCNCHLAGPSHCSLLLTYSEVWEPVFILFLEMLHTLKMSPWFHFAAAKVPQEVGKKTGHKTFSNYFCFLSWLFFTELHLKTEGNFSGSFMQRSYTDLHLPPKTDWQASAPSWSPALYFP